MASQVKEGVDFAATIEGIAKDFNWNAKLVTSVKSLGCINLDEFRFYWSDETKVQTWADTQKWDEDANAHNLQTARLKRVWHAVRKQAELREADKGALATGDLDELLDSDELGDRKKQFWHRYHLAYPLEIQPGDQLVSRVAREMSKLMLIVANLWLVRNMLHQITSTKKRKHLVGDLYTDEPDELSDKDASKDISAYLNRLLTYLISLAIAGIEKRSGAPAANTEVLGSNSADFVCVPLDIVMAYYHRALKVVEGVPYPSRMAYIQRLDTEDRAEWVKVFREGNFTLGQVIQQIMQKRDAHWVPPPTPKRPLDDKSLSPVKADRPTKNNRNTAKDGPSKRSRLTLADGTPLCDKFNAAKGCQIPNCQKEHRCSTVLRNGQSCGARNHNFTSCPVVKGG